MRWTSLFLVGTCLVCMHAGQVAALVGRTLEEARICTLKEGMTDCAGAFFGTCVHRALLRRLLPAQHGTAQPGRGSSAAGAAPANGGGRRAHAAVERPGGRHEQSAGENESGLRFQVPVSTGVGRAQPAQHGIGGLTGLRSRVRVGMCTELNAQLST
eukprot:jgi/Ulvmu1/9853/UM057_0007.1